MFLGAMLIHFCVKIANNEPIWRNLNMWCCVYCTQYKTRVRHNMSALEASTFKRSCYATSNGTLALGYICLSLKWLHIEGVHCIFCRLKSSLYLHHTPKAIKLFFNDWLIACWSHTMVQRETFRCQEIAATRRGLPMRRHWYESSADQVYSSKHLSHFTTSTWKDWTIFLDNEDWQMP